MIGDSPASRINSIAESFRRAEAAKHEPHDPLADLQRLKSLHADLCAFGFDLATAALELAARTERNGMRANPRYFSLNAKITDLQHLIAAELKSMDVEIKAAKP